MSKPPERLELFERIGYDPCLEAHGMERLSEFDLADCRRALGRLVGTLDLGRVDGDAGTVVQLLANVLHKVNDRIYGRPGDDRVYHVNRVRIIEEFSACGSPGAARELFLPSLNRLLAPLQGGRRAKHPLAIRARSYIDRQYHRRLSLSSVAEQLAVSSNYLSRVFRREMEMTLTAYIQKVRVERARVLMAEGAKSMSEIAYQVGYQNYRDFYRNFVKYENASPRRIRSRLARDRRPAGRG